MEFSRSKSSSRITHDSSGSSSIPPKYPPSQPLEIDVSQMHTPPPLQWYSRMYAAMVSKHPQIDRVLKYIRGPRPKIDLSGASNPARSFVEVAIPELYPVTFAQSPHRSLTLRSILGNGNTVCHSSLHSSALPGRVRRPGSLPSSASAISSDSPSSLARSRSRRRRMRS